MTQKNTISIAMATYNGAKYLQQQLDSISNQTILPAELVVTDDGSTDNTLEILEAFGKTAPFPVRIHRNEVNLGYRANFMKCVSLCQGDVIALSDQDDVWKSIKLEACLHLIEANNLLLIYHNATVTDENLKPVRKFYHHKARLSEPMSFLPRHFGSGFAMVFDASLVKFNKFWETSHDIFRDDGQKEGHDHWFMFLATCMGRTQYLEECLVFYRRHQTTTTNLSYKITFLDKIHIILKTNITSIKSRGICAANREKTMLEGAKLFHGEAAAFCGLAAITYRKIKENCQMRVELYNTLGRYERLKIMYKIWDNMGYTTKQRVGDGAIGFARDVFSGIILGGKP